MKYKLSLMFIFSFLVHITIAGALVYVPYQVSVNSDKKSVGEVIWGRIYKGEGRRQKAEGRSKRQEARSKKLETRSQKEEQAPTPQIENPEMKEGHHQYPLTFSVRGRGVVELSPNEPSINNGSQTANNIPSPLRGEGQGGGEPRNSPHLFKWGQAGEFSGDQNLPLGNDNGELFPSSNGGQSSHGEGDEAINAEKGRIYNDQLNALAEQVKKEIEKNKYYPLLAKLRGIEGTVNVNFLIGQDGKPGRIALLKSSGSQVLDDSAIKTIKNLKPLRNINPELRELDITVPITYRLKEDR